MNVSELKQIIGEATLMHFEQSSKEREFPDWISQEDQQKLFDDFVNGGYDAFTSNPNLMAQLSAATKQDIQDYFIEKLQKWREMLRGLSAEELRMLISKATPLM